MRVRAEVGADKLRGGFYTPDALADFLLRRVRSHGLPPGARILEPSVGDGAFVRAIARAAIDCADFVGIEVNDIEANKARAALTTTCTPGSIVHSSALTWALGRTGGQYDVTLGNLPFVRFQFISTADREAAKQVVAEAGLSESGVSNLWIPMLLASLSRLKVGGSFAFVLPAECFTGVSAGRVREWLLATQQDLTVDLFAPGSFPGVLQEVVVLAGRRAATRQAVASLRLIEHDRADVALLDGVDGATREHALTPTSESWTRLLLTTSHLEALEAAEALPFVRRLKDVAKFEVATVTGANGYFSVTADTAREHDMHGRLTPLLPRIRHATGLSFTLGDHAALAHEGHPSYLLTLSSEEDVAGHHGLQRYIAAGEAAALHERFKCRIRQPWYAVPGIKPAPLMLTKRSHRYPRMVLNAASVATTDTIYRGWPHPESAGNAVVASFHNSLSLLSAELEGRSFGGGVLELVPSEVNRLLVPYAAEMAAELPRLDALSREEAAVEPEALVVETDKLLMKHVPGLTDDMVERLQDARNVLVDRRMART